MTGTMKVTPGASGAPTAGPDGMALNLTGVIQSDILDKAKKPVGVFTAMFDPAASFTVPLSGLKLALDPEDATVCTVTVPPITPATTSPASWPVRTIPFQSLNAFSPDEVAASIPELHRLSVIRGLLLELQSNLRNNRPFAKAVKEALAKLTPGDLTTSKTSANTSYPSLKVPSPSSTENS